MGAEAMTDPTTAEQWAGYLRAMASERRRIGDPSYVGLTAGELDQAADEMERLASARREMTQRQPGEPEADNTVHGDIEVITSHHRQKAFVRISKIAAVVEIRPGGPTNLIFTTGGELEICGGAEYWRRVVAIFDLEHQPETR